MKKLPILLLTFILFISLLWVSCDNNNDLLDYTKISGIVHDAGTGEPLSNTKVRIIDSGNFFDNTASVSFPTDTFYTDSTGYYEFIYDHIRGNSYSVEAQKDGYWERNVQDNNGIIPDKENKKDIGLYPFAWLKIHIKNVNPFDENDLLSAYTHPTASNTQNHYGTGVDFIFTEKIEGNKDKAMTWWVTKNNITTQYWDTIYCEGHKTTEYELFY